MDFSRSYILNIFIGVIIIFALIIFIDVSNIDLNPNPVNKKVVQVVNIEALKNKKKKKKKKKKDSTTPDETTDETTTDETITDETTTDETPLPPPEPNKPNTSINMSPIDDFCKSSLKDSCDKLTKKNCNATSCCIMLNGEKCVAGNQDGPTFKTESGEDITVDYYYYQNKCYGDNCPAK